jgi:hypothetical protein
VGTQDNCMYQNTWQHNAYLSKHSCADCYYWRFFNRLVFINRRSFLRFKTNVKYSHFAYDLTIEMGSVFGFINGPGFGPNESPLGRDNL